MTLFLGATDNSDNGFFDGVHDFFHSGTWLVIRNLMIFFVVVFWLSPAYWVYKDAEVESTYLICPVCTTKLRQACVSCKQPLEPLWQVCPFCETPVVRRPTVDLAPSLEPALDDDPFAAGYPTQVRAPGTARRRRRPAQ